MSAYDPKRTADHRYQSEPSRILLRCRATRQADREHRSPAQLTRHEYVAAHHARKLA
jgi:hypothetical protein